MLGQQLWLLCWRSAHLFLCWAAFGRRVCVSSARRGSLALNLRASLALQMGSRRRAFVWRRFRPGVQTKHTNRNLAVVEAREELNAERRADRDERAHKIDRERERRAVVRDVLGQAVPVVLAAPADGQAADGAART